MTTATHSERYARARHDCKLRLTVALIVTGALFNGAVWSGQAYAQEKPVRVGVLSFFTLTGEPEWASDFERLRRNLADQGWIAGKNIVFEYRSAKGEPSQFEAAATALVGLDVDVILANSAPALRAAHAATRTIPIVATDYTTDPVAEGYVENFAQPGGNVTGVFLGAPEFAGKWFELLQSMIPDLSRVAVLWDPAPGANHLEAVRFVADSLGIKLQVLEVRKASDIDLAFNALSGSPQAIVILPSPMNWWQSARLARLALEYRLPATSMAPHFANAGGVISYGPDLTWDDERIAALLAKILGGARPADLPVERPRKFQLVVNLKTAKALGITIPHSILLRADEVIR
ncbi:MAG: ABC transporter substrate-binding protein [Betaproteobacteria bacterium]|nr:MAG: ABC transporter substrate-binding protein [Betaproteobacteria bacterium]